MNYLGKCYSRGVLRRSISEARGGNPLFVWNGCHPERSEGSTKVSRSFATLKMTILSSLLLVFLFSITAFAQDSIDNTSAVNAADSYKLGAGDKLKVIVFGEDSLSGEFEIDGQGMVAVPLIGNVQAGGIDARTFEKNITAKLKDGYLVNPRVSVEVLNFRPFFILGEVKSPGSYPYVNGLTVLNAVALAGGYTHRARTDRVLLRHGSDAKEKEFESGEDGKVLPGDVLRVTERFF